MTNHSPGCFVNEVRESARTICSAPAQLWVALLAVPLLGERMTASRLGSVMLGFLGVLVIVRPGLASFQPAALLVLAAALAFAISLIATKKLTHDVSTFVIIF